MDCKACSGPTNWNNRIFFRSKTYHQWCYPQQCQYFPASSGPFKCTCCQGKVDELYEDQCWDCKHHSRCTHCSRYRKRMLMCEHCHQFACVRCALDNRTSCYAIINPPSILGRDIDTIISSFKPCVCSFQDELKQAMCYTMSCRNLKPQKHAHCKSCHFEEFKCSVL